VERCFSIGSRASIEAYRAVCFRTAFLCICHRVTEYTVPGVLKERNAFVLNGLEVREDYEARV
jgi:hypothetical protein